MTVIEFKDMGFGYDEGRMVLEGIDLRIDSPGLYCIIGPNGVGKSTIVKCISRINEPTEGDVLLDGRSVKDMSLKEISKIVTFVPAHQTDAFSMSVVDTVMIGRYNRSHWGSREEDLRKVAEVLKLLHIEDLAYRRYSELSAGQHQKVTIARGLVQETPVLILDEPTSNLDVQYQVYVTEMLRAVAERKGIIVLMISHDLNIAAKYAHCIVMMEKPGRIYAVGPPREVMTPENIERVYSVESRVIEDDECSEREGMEASVPHVVLGRAIIRDRSGHSSPPGNRDAPVEGSRGDPDRRGDDGLRRGRAPREGPGPDTDSGIRDGDPPHRSASLGRIGPHGPDGVRHPDLLAALRFRQRSSASSGRMPIRARIGSPGSRG